MQALKGKIEHVVVLMMENRSFDHMLGYLALQGLPVEGLRPGMANAWGGRSYGINPLTDFSIEVGPGHHREDVLRQLGLEAGQSTPSMSGFVKSYADHVLGTRRLPDVMGYYTGAELPVYDFLAREYCVSDNWFCSFAGPTWPNRFFAVAGQTGGVTSNRPPTALRTIFDLLDEQQVSWQYYSHDVAFIRTLPQFRTRGAGQGISKIGAFGRALEQGTLPAFSWIDPNFTLLSAGLHFSFANDDHAPADVRRGQKLVASIYNAIRHSRYWENTLFVVAYDEHGGFFDHVPPPRAVSPDGNPDFEQLGPRVPALLVSPWLARGSVDHVVRDHTSIIKTVLGLFTPDIAPASVRLGARVDTWSKDLSDAPWEAAARSECVYAPNVDVADLSSSRLYFRTDRTKKGQPREFGELDATDMQQDMLELKQDAVAAGVPEESL